MFLELCTGLSLPKHSEIPKNSQHLNSNSPCYIEHTGDDSDDTGSEHSDESVDGFFATPTEVNFEYIKIFSHTIVRIVCMILA